MNPTKLRVVDSHVHLWDRSLFQYSWHEPVPLFVKNYFLEDYRKATSEIQLDSIVYVEAAMDLQPGA
jgi:predicted TIM-barrel fold metal-dependent hydrolase